MSRKSLILVASLMACMALALTCTSFVKAENYAVIITGKTPNSIPPGPYSWDLQNREIFPEFWHDTYLMWEVLYAFGWKDENIHVLFGDGVDWGERWVRYRADYYPPLGHITDDSCYTHNVIAVYDSLAQIMTNQDLLFTYIFDHGGNNGVTNDWHSCFYTMDDSIWDTTFARIVDACPYNKRIFCMEQCYSGGFINDLAKNDNNTFIMTAVDSENMALIGLNPGWHDGQDTLVDEYHDGEYYIHGIFDYHMFNAMRLKTIVGNDLSIADLDSNGLASMEEVWNWTYNGTIHACEFPQVADYDDIGGSLYLNIPPYQPKGFSGQRVQNHVVLSWNKNGEHDLDHYNVYKKTYDDSTQTYTNWYLLAQTGCTTYTDWNFVPNYAGSDTVWYKIAAVDSAGQRSDYSPTVSAPGEIRQQSQDGGIAALATNEFLLLRHYPNPFNLETTIRFTLPEASFVTLNVYDVTGRIVAELTKGLQTPGSHEAFFKARSLASGVYLCRLQYGNKTLTQKMVLLK